MTSRRIRFVAPARSSGHVRSARAAFVSRASERERIASWPGIRSAPRMDLGHSAGSGPLNRPRAARTHLPAALQKEENFSSRSERARVQPVISARWGCNWIFRFVRSASRWRRGTVKEIPIAEFCRILGNNSPTSADRGLASFGLQMEILSPSAVAITSRARV